MREAQTVVEEFVARLRAAAPEKDHLLGRGYPTDYADEVINRYVCKRKNLAFGNTPSDAMLLLHNTYDLSTVSVGGITFEENCLRTYPITWFNRIRVL